MVSKKMAYQNHWLQVKDGDLRALGLMRRHYTWREYKDGRPHRLFAGPGEKMVLLTVDCRALFVWRKFIESGQTAPRGVNCAVFRNESDILSSVLIREAVSLALERWPGERLYTYVNPRKVNGDGKCFKAAGWVKLKKRTKTNKLIELEYTEGKR